MVAHREGAEVAEAPTLIRRAARPTRQGQTTMHFSMHVGTTPEPLYPSAG